MFESSESIINEFCWEDEFRRDPLSRRFVEILELYEKETRLNIINLYVYRDRVLKGALDWCKELLFLGFLPVLVCCL